MNHHYEIVPQRKKSYLYRVEPDGTPVKLAVADDKKTMFQLIRLKAFFEEEMLPLEELHSAEEIGINSVKTVKPNWNSCTPIGGKMEIWEISNAQTRALQDVRDKEKDGLHRSMMGTKTADVLIRHNLVKQRPSCKAYLTLSDEGKLLLERIER